MKNSASGILTAFLAGAAVGALFGVLYAPDKGSVTRSRIRTAGEDLSEEFAETIDAIRKEFNKVTKEAVVEEEEGEVKEAKVKEEPAATKRTRKPRKTTKKPGAKS